MIDYDMALEAGIEAANIFAEKSEANILHAAHAAEIFLNQRCRGAFVRTTIVSFNKNVHGCEARLLQYTADSYRILVDFVDLTAPISTDWISPTQRNAPFSSMFSNQNTESRLMV